MAAGAVTIHGPGRGRGSGIIIISNYGGCWHNPDNRRRKLHRDDG